MNYSTPYSAVSGRNKFSFFRFLGILVVFVGLSVNAGWAQIIAWQLNGVTGDESTKIASTLNANLNSSALTHGSGLSVSALANAYGATNFTNGGTKATAISGNKYNYFTINAKSGYKASLSTLDARFRRSGTGPNAFLWQYSTDGTTFTDIGSADISYTLTTSNGDVQTQIDLSGVSALQNVINSTTITLRLLGWGASAATGTFGIGRSATSTPTDYSLSIGGTVVAGFSNDATLSAMTLSSGILSPAFSSSTISYISSVSNATSSITITPTVNESHATVQARVNGGTWVGVSNSLALNVGSNTIDVLVTAQDNTTTKTYTITVTRASASFVNDAVGFSATASSSSQINLSATANASLDQIVVLTNRSGTFTTPTNGTAAGNVGEAFAGGIILYKGSAASLTNHSGLTSNTLYYYKAFSFDGSTNFSNGLTANATTAKIEPSNQPTELRISTTVTTSNIPFIWTAALPGSQTPDGYLVKLNTGTITDPIDGIDPGVGSTAISSGNASFKASTGASFLSDVAGTMYNIKVYSYTNSGSFINFNTTSVPSFNVATLPNPVNTSAFTATSATAANITWTAAAGYDNINHTTLVFVKPTGSIATGTPTYAPSAYIDDNAFGNGTVYQNDPLAKCVYKGDGTSVSVTGLSANTTYYALIYTVVDTSNSNSTNSSSAIQTTNGTTNLSAPNTTAASSISSTGFTANWGAVNGASGYKLDVSTTNFSNVNITETFTSIGGGAANSYNTRTWTGDGGIGWSTYKARIDQVVTTGNDAITFQDLTFAYLLSDAISGNPTNISFDIKQVFTGSGGNVILSILSGSNFTSSSIIGTYSYSATASNISANVTGITGPYKIKIENGNTNARPCIDNLSFQKELYTAVPTFFDYTVSGTHQVLTGLAPNTTYYYRVRAVGGNSTSPNSNVTPVTTLASYAISASSNDVNKGTVSSAGGMYDAGIAITLTALPASASYRFVNWTDGNGNFVSKTNPYNFNASANSTLVANFADVAAPISISTAINASTFAACATCDVTIANGGALTIDETKTFNSVNVAPGSKLTLLDGNTLTASVTLQSTSSGTATYVDYNTGSSLPSISGVVNQYLTGGRNWYISSPVTSVTANNVIGTSSASTKPSSIVWYDETKGSTSPWTTVTTQQLTPTKGYIATNGSPASTDGIIAFTGTLNTGDISTTTANPLTLSSTGVKDGFNLVGNPYPSYLDWSQVTKTNLHTTMWYRTVEGAVYKFYTYNSLNGNGYNGEGIAVPAKVTKWIPPMQAFWVRVASGTGSIGFLNSARGHNDVSTNLLKAPSATKSTRQLLRLQVSNGKNDDEAVVYFDPNASDGFDTYDSHKMINGSTSPVPDIYTTVGSEKLVINGMKSIPTDTEIQLVVEANQSDSTSFSLKACEMSNFEVGTHLLLKDYATGVVKDITDGSPYKFTPDTSVPAASRFTLVFRAPSITTGVNTAGDSGNESGALVFRNANNRITVSCIEALNGQSSVEVYNAVGQQLISNRLVKTVTIIENSLLSGTYLVKVVTNGKSVTSKVIIQ